jgi:hypothetical protein
MTDNNICRPCLPKKLPKIFSQRHVLRLQEHSIFFKYILEHLAPGIPTFLTPGHYFSRFLSHVFYQSAVKGRQCLAESPQIGGRGEEVLRNRQKHP